MCEILSNKQKKKKLVLNLNLIGQNWTNQLLMTRFPCAKPRNKMSANNLSYITIGGNSCNFRFMLTLAILFLLTFDMWLALCRHCIMGSSSTLASLYPSTNACLTRNRPWKTWSPSTRSFTTPSCGSSEYQDWFDWFTDVHWFNK